LFSEYLCGLQIIMMVYVVQAFTSSNEASLNQGFPISHVH